LPAGLCRVVKTPHRRAQNPPCGGFRSGELAAAENPEFALGRIARRPGIDHDGAGQAAAAMDLAKYWQAPSVVKENSPAVPAFEVLAL
jgi:hypothetical protein